MQSQVESPLSFNPIQVFADSMEVYTNAFIALLVIGTLLQLWLLGRQASHVKAHSAAVPEAFSEEISLQDHQKAASYTLAKVLPERVELIISPLILLAWTLGGGLNWLDQSLLGFELSTLWQGTALILAFMVIGMIIDIPMSIWRTFGIETRFGFNNMTAGQFVKDKIMELVLSFALGTPLILVILWLMQSAGDLWWLWAWMVWMSFMLFVTWAYPVVIAPLFNKFEPMEEGELRGRLESLLERCGFKSNGMFVMDGSKRSAHGNAYFTGFGKNKRIVFFDTLLTGLSPTEVEAVLAHELGHFKRKHIRKSLIVTSVMSLLGLALLGWLSQQNEFYNSLGIERQSDGLALLLFMLILPVVTLFFSPIMAALSRKHEFEADDYAAEQTQAQDLISGLVKMYRDNASTLTPDPLYSAFYHSHPPAPVRIAHLSSKLSS